MRYQKVGPFWRTGLGIRFGSAALVPDDLVILCFAERLSGPWAFKTAAFSKTLVSVSPSFSKSAKVQCVSIDCEFTMCLYHNTGFDCYTHTHTRGPSRVSEQL